MIQQTLTFSMMIFKFYLNSQQIMVDAKLTALVLVHTDIGQVWK